MKRAKVFQVARREFLDVVRDRRTLFTLIVLPLLLYPVLLSVMSELTQAGLRRLEHEPTAIALTGAVPASLAAELQKEALLPQRPASHPAEALRRGELRAWVDVAPQPSGASDIVIHFDAAEDRSRMAADRVEKVAERYRAAIRDQRLEAHGLQASDVDPFAVTPRNDASETKMGGKILGSLLPMFLIMAVLLGAFYPALDATAGEKERGTLETILATPLLRSELLTGKLLSVCGIACIATFMNLVSMVLVFTSGLVSFGAAKGSLDFHFPWSASFLVAGAMVPFACMVSAVMMGVAMFARSFREAQGFVTPVYLLFTLPTMAAGMPGLKLTAITAAIPVVNICLMLRELFEGTPDMALSLMVVLFTATQAFLAIAIIMRLFDLEDLLFGGGSLRVPRAPSLAAGQKVLPTGHACILMALALLFTFHGGLVLQSLFGLRGFTATQIGLLLLAVGAIALTKLDFRESFFLRAPKLRAWLAVPFLVLGFRGVAGIIGYWYAKSFPSSQAEMQAISDFLTPAKHGIPAWAGLFFFGILPGICEEALFRGPLLSSFLRRHSPWAAIVITAVAFGIFHMSLLRFAPTAFIGLSLGYLTWRSGSLFPAMAAHALNNGLAVSLLAYPAWGKWAETHAPVLTEPVSLTNVALCAAAFVIGMALLSGMPGPVARRT